MSISPQTEACKRFKARLVGIPGVDRVAISRIWPMDLETGVWVCIYSPDEPTIARGGGMRPGQRRSTRSMVVRAVIVAPSPVEPDEAFEPLVNEIASAIEMRILADPHLSDPDGRPWAQDTAIASTNSGVDPYSPHLVVKAVNFTVTHSHREGQPGVPFIAS